MINLFRQRYPYGSLISELVQIEHGKYIVRVSVQIEGKTLATGLAADTTVEQAEDHARIRALALLNLEQIAIPDGEKPSSETVEPGVAIATPAKPPQTASVKASKKENTKKSYSKLEPEIEPEPDNGALLAEYSDEPVSLPFEELPSIMVDEEPPSSQTAIPSFEVAHEEPVDFTDVIAKIDLEMKRLGWTKEQGRDYLIQTYGKKSRQLLSDDELLEFLRYLENQ